MNMIQRTNLVLGIPNFNSEVPYGAGYFLTTKPMYIINDSLD
jgi:hypothetical protein